MRFTEDPLSDARRSGGAVLAAAVRRRWALRRRGRGLGWPGIAAGGRAGAGFALDGVDVEGRPAAAGGAVGPRPRARSMVASAMARTRSTPQRTDRAEIPYRPDGCGHGAGRRGRRRCDPRCLGGGRARSTSQYRSMSDSRRRVSRAPTVPQPRNPGASVTRAAAGAVHLGRHPFRRIH